MQGFFFIQTSTRFKQVFNIHIFKYRFTFTALPLLTTIFLLLASYLVQKVSQSETTRGKNDICRHGGSMIIMSG